MALSDKDRRSLAEKVECEGFDYAFRQYSKFSEIKDKKFHKLREAYVKAGEALEDYLDLDSVDLEETDVDSD